MKLTVLVPVYNGGDDIDACLAALANSSRVADHTIIIDDGSTDNCAKTAGARYGFTWHFLQDGPQGPARARNHGALLAGDDTDILIFIDADVVVHKDTLAKIEAQFVEHPDIDALFGSYDDEPRAPSAVSTYRNLLHHHTHQTGNPEARTFWAGCGAVRMSVFKANNGFSENYEKPSIEDIEFGARLHKRGHRIRLCPDIQVTHLKNWTLLSMIKTDVFSRAIPWTQLLHEDKSHAKELNLGTKNKISAAIALLLVLTVIVSLTQPYLLLGVAVLAIGFAYLELPLLHLLWRKGGPMLLLPGFFLHILYYCYATAAFVFTKLQLLLTTRKAPPAAREDT